jgi:hypothetical protein
MRAWFELLNDSGITGGAQKEHIVNLQRQQMARNRRMQTMNSAK